MFVHAACERKDTRLVDQQIVSSKKNKTKKYFEAFAFD
jgi:hypothetical protein